MVRLTATAVKAASKPGRYGDGDGLYLVVGKTGGKSWVVRVQKDGRRRDIGLGSAKKVPLKLARQRATEVRTQVEIGIDPISERKKAAGIPTFREAAIKVHSEQKKAWKNAKHRAQWLSTLKAYAFPAFGDRPISQVTEADVRDALIPIWLTKVETGRRLRQRINTVIDWAVAKGYREMSLAMPVIDKSLPKQRAKVKHHRALPFVDLPKFLDALRSKQSIGRLAVEFAILTAARSGEVRMATWDEIDTKGKLWTVPAERMKAGREHVVPLSDEALDVLKRAKPYRRGDSDLIFPGMKRGQPLSDMTLTKVLRDMEVDATVHGFRSTFRDWVAECTDYQGELAEAALAHVIADKTEAAYRRGSMLDKRRHLMNDWARFALR